MGRGRKIDTTRKSGERERENNDRVWLPISAITRKCIGELDRSEMPETGAKCVLTRNKEFSRVAGGIEGEEKKKRERISKG